MSLMELPPPPSGYELRMPRCQETRDLRKVGIDAFGRDAILSSDAADAWLAMRRSSESHGLQLLLLSGYRSVARQAEIVANKLKAGLEIGAILRVSAYPGFSEHHTGRAIDLGSPSCEHFSEGFEKSAEFAWLLSYASEFGFSLSYPRDNPYGIAYEPWHWCLTKSPAHPPRHRS